MIEKLVWERIFKSGQASKGNISHRLLELNPSFVRAIFTPVQNFAHVYCSMIFEGVREPGNCSMSGLSRKNMI